MKLYKLFWTNEGIGWCRKNYIILKPTGNSKNWKLRRMRGEPGMQTVEREDNFKTEKEAFKAGNKAVKAFKRVG